MNNIYIGADIDDTISPFLKPLLELYNKKYGDSLRFDDIYQYELKPFIKPECKQIFQEFVDEQFFDKIDVYPEAVDILTYLHKRGHEIRFATKGHPYTIRARDNLLTRNFKFYKSSNLIACSEKQLLKFDVLIDDHEGNLIGGDYFGLIVNQPWNAHFSEKTYGTKRIFDWSEVPAIIERLERSTRRI